MTYNLKWEGGLSIILCSSCYMLFKNVISFYLENNPGRIDYLHFFKEEGGDIKKRGKNDN